MGSAKAAIVLAASIWLAIVPTGQSQDHGGNPFEPRQGQAGKDVIWVPTPDPTVQKMLDIARASPDDYLIDLGSGDGRMVIAAAKRGITGHGVEYNPRMVEYARKKAAEAGVADKATFSQGDMYEADISKASLLALFLLSENLEKLVPNFLKLKPGTRIVINGYQIYGWDPDAVAQAEGDCGHWCTVYLYIVPAQVSGVWRVGNQQLVLKQEFQKLQGTLGSVEIEDAVVEGSEIRFHIGATDYIGRVEGNEITGRIAGTTTGIWRARKG